MKSGKQRWVYFLTRLAWLVQPDSARIRVDPEQCISVRARLARIEAEFQHCQAEADPVIRSEGTRRAVLDVFALIGEAGPRVGEADTLASGFQRVESTLEDGVLKDALQELRDTAPSVVLSPSSLRALSELFLWSTQLLDVRTPRERKLEPWARRLAVTSILLLGVFLVFRPRNLAAGQNVTASSICALTAPAPYASQRLARVVDEVEREASFAMCTNNEVHPWVQVDLGTQRKVSSVVVHGRTDCCWGLDDTPLSIQVSTDGKRFKTLAVRKSLIMEDFPWTASFSSRDARYVRLTNETNATKNIVINEIEVYGR